MFKTTVVTFATNLGREEHQRRSITQGAQEEHIKQPKNVPTQNVSYCSKVLLRKDVVHREGVESELELTLFNPGYQKAKSPDMLKLEAVIDWVMEMRGEWRNREFVAGGLKRSEKDT